MLLSQRRYEIHIEPPLTRPTEGKIVEQDGKYNITIPCAQNPISLQQTIDISKMYVQLDHSEGVLLVASNGILYSDNNELCTAFGQRKSGNAGLIAGVVITIIVVIIAAIGGYWWHKKRQTGSPAEHAPLHA